METYKDKCFQHENLCFYLLINDVQFMFVISLKGFTLFDLLFL